MTTKPFYTFDAVTDTGVDLVPLNSTIQIEDSGGVPQYITLTDRTGIDAATTISALLLLTAQYEPLSSPAYTAVNFSAGADQSLFGLTYTVGTLSVFTDGVKLNPDLYTATNGTSVTLNSGVTLGTWVQMISTNENGYGITEFSIKELNDVLTTMTPADGQFLVYDTTNGWQAETLVIPEVPAMGGYNYVTKSFAYTATAGDFVYCNTLQSGAWTLTLPITPNANDIVSFLDTNSYFATANLTIGRNGQTIMGLAEDMIISTDNISSGLIYTGSDWRLL